MFTKDGKEIATTTLGNNTSGDNLTRTYDAENRLKTVSSKTGDTTTLIKTTDYNGDGQRIQKVEGDTTTNYYYQDGPVSYTTDGKIYNNYERGYRKGKSHKGKYRCAYVDLDHQDSTSCFGSASASDQSPYLVTPRNMKSYKFSVGVINTAWSSSCRTIGLGISTASTGASYSATNYKFRKGMTKMARKSLNEKSNPPAMLGRME